MRTFHIGFSKNRDGKIFSKLLQWYMKRDYSHVFLDFNDTKDNILHAEINDGVNYWADDKFTEENIKTKTYKIEVSDEFYAKMKSNLSEHVGHKYGFIQNIGIVLVGLCRNLGLGIANPFTDGDNCSELVFNALRTIHPELASTHKYRLNTIRPDHIEDILIKYGYDRTL